MTASPIYFSYAIVFFRKITRLPINYYFFLKLIYVYIICIHKFLLFYFCLFRKNYFTKNDIAIFGALWEKFIKYDYFECNEKLSNLAISFLAFIFLAYLSKYNYFCIHSLYTKIFITLVLNLIFLFFYSKCYIFLSFYQSHLL